MGKRAAVQGWQFALVRAYAAYTHHTQYPKLYLNLAYKKAFNEGVSDDFPPVGFSIEGNTDDVQSFTESRNEIGQD